MTIIFQSIFYKPKPQLKFKIDSMRFYGETKLPKPKCLKGIKQSFSIDFILKKCKCACFIVGNDLYIQHRDYFSSEFNPPVEDHGMPLTCVLSKYFNTSRSLKSFVYPDCWGSVVFRNEAWIILENIMLDIENNVFQPKIADEITRQQEIYHGFKELDLAVGYWDRFYDNIISQLYKLK